MRDIRCVRWLLVLGLVVAGTACGGQRAARTQQAAATAVLPTAVPTTGGAPVPTPVGAAVPPTGVAPVPTDQGSATPLAATSATPTLQPYHSESFALSAVRPAGWTEVMPGIFARLRTADDLAYLYTVAFANAPAGWGTYYIMRVMGLLEPPPVKGTRRSGALEWTISSVQAQDAQGRAIAAALASAELDGTLYIVFLQLPGAESANVFEPIFYPVLDSLRPEPVTLRDQLTAADLDDSASAGAGALNNAYFAPLKSTGPSAPQGGGDTLTGDQSAPLGDHGPAAPTALEGTLTVAAQEMLCLLPFGQPVSAGADRFPGFQSEFVTSGDDLLPVRQDVLPALDPASAWRIILSPGKVWSEPGDVGSSPDSSRGASRGHSRAAFPFILINVGGGEAHNGLATFLYDAASVSALRFQVVQETCSWNKADMSGQAAMTYAPGSVSGKPAVTAAFTADRAVDVPVRPWSELEARYDREILTRFTGAVSLLDISATGLMAHNILYLQPFYTRYGAFPYGSAMRHGVFSVTKTMAGAVSLLWLAQKYGPGVFDEKVLDYVQMNAAHDGWRSVTFGDCLNMATGIGDDPSPTVADITSEENQPKFARFCAALSTADKIAVIGAYGKYPWGPNAKVRYNSTNTFVLSVAMQHYVQAKEGAGADYWDRVMEEVYRPIGVSALPILRTVESDGSRGVPILGYGLYPTVQDAAKLARLLQAGGRHNGKQLLHAGKLAEAMETIEASGLGSSEVVAAGEGRYHEAFWALPMRLGNGQKVMVPYMTGYGGNRVVFAPNDVVAIRFTDGVNYELQHLVQAALAIK